MHLKFREKVATNNCGVKYKEYWPLDSWVENKFSVGYDRTIYDGLEMYSLRLGWFWFGLCEQVEKVENKI